MLNDHNYLGSERHFHGSVPQPLQFSVLLFSGGTTSLCCT